ncbi:MAG TPA: beta-propeller fold lactonase family protein [Terracidiphilus sp.]|jgi:6-phosphogluconolactonase (cycloisomerase 2 family)
MKLSKYSGRPVANSRRWGQLSLISLAGLLVATLLSACQLVTIDYLFVSGTFKTSQGADVGAIQVFAVDSQSGALRFAAGTDSKPFATGGLSPVAMVVSSDFANLYVAVADNNTVVHFAVASDGTLTKKDSVSLAAPPTALAINTAGKYLYVVSGRTTATLTEYPLSSGTIGSATAQQSMVIPGFPGDTVVPTGVIALANNNAVMATMYDKSAYNPGGVVTSDAHPGWVFSYTVGSGGALTPSGPYQAGVKPSGLAADPTDRFVYVTDYASDELIGYGITNTSTLNFLITGPYRTGSEPSAVSLDPRGKYIYVSNALDSTVTAYAIDLATGIPSQVINTVGNQSNVTDTQPVAITVEPALGRFVYTANLLGNSVSGFQLNPNTGALSSTQATPYPTESKPLAVALVPHGNHSLQETTP